MTKRDILSISLKILGVVSIMRAVAYIPAVGMAISMFLRNLLSVRGISYSYLGTTIIPPVLTLVIAYILLKWGDSIASRLLRVDSELPALDTQWEVPAFTLALKIIGVLCLTRIIGAIQSLFIFIRIPGQNAGITNPRTLAGMIAAIAYLLIGVYLISGGKHLVKLAFRGRATMI